MNTISSSRGGIYGPVGKILHEEIKDGDTILEAGSGSGLICLECCLNKPAAKATLLDIDEGRLNAAQKNFADNKATANFVLGSVDNMNMFADNSFDVVFNEGVIEHAPIDIDKAIAEMVRVSKKKVIIEIPDGNSFIYVAKKFIRRSLGIWEWDKKYGYERSIRAKSFKKYQYKRIVIGKQNVVYVINK
jgi:ubiquinone/menaquinone biosynthesis C-methylase UbiE